MFEGKHAIAENAVKVGVNVGFFMSDTEGKHPEIKHGVICGQIIKEPYTKTNTENPAPVIDIAVAGIETPEGNKHTKSGIPVNMIFAVTDEELAQWIGKPPVEANTEQQDIPSSEGSAESDESDIIPMDNATPNLPGNQENASHFEKHAEKMASDPHYKNHIQNDGAGESDAIPTDENPPVENQGGESETPPANQEEQSDETPSVRQDDSANDSVESSSPETANENNGSQESPATESDQETDADNAGNTDDSSESGGNDEKQQNTAETAEKPKTEGALASRLSQEARDAHVKLYRLLVEVEDAAESCVPHFVKKINQKQAVNFAKSAERMGKTIRSDFAIRGLEYLIDDPDEQK